MHEDDHAASLVLVEANARGMASPACAVCIGALNLLSQVGAAPPRHFHPGAQLPTLFLLAQDIECITSTAGSATSSVTLAVRSDKQVYVHLRSLMRADDRRLIAVQHGHSRLSLWTVVAVDQPRPLTIAQE